MTTEQKLLTAEREEMTKEEPPRPAKDAGARREMFIF